MINTLELPQKIKSQLGKEVDYNFKRKGIKTTIRGIVVDAKKFAGHISNVNDPSVRLDGYQLKIKPIDGSRAIWTTAFPIEG